MTKRQREVIELVIRGVDVPEIALRLGISVWTVRAHVNAVAARFDDPHPPMRRVFLHARELLADSA